MQIFGRYILGFVAAALLSIAGVAWAADGGSGGFNAAAYRPKSQFPAGGGGYDRSAPAGGGGFDLQVATGRSDTLVIGARSQ